MNGCEVLGRLYVVRGWLSGQLAEGTVVRTEVWKLLDGPVFTSWHFHPQLYGWIQADLSVL